MRRTRCATSTTTSCRISSVRQAKTVGSWARIARQEMVSQSGYFFVKGEAGDICMHRATCACEVAEQIPVEPYWSPSIYFDASRSSMRLPMTGKLSAIQKGTVGAAGLYSTAKTIRIITLLPRPNSNTGVRPLPAPMPMETTPRVIATHAAATIKKAARISCSLAGSVSALAASTTRPSAKLARHPAPTIVNPPLIARPHSLFNAGAGVFSIFVSGLFMLEDYLRR